MTKKHLRTKNFDPQAVAPVLDDRKTILVSGRQVDRARHARAAGDTPARADRVHRAVQPAIRGIYLRPGSPRRAAFLAFHAHLRRGYWPSPCRFYAFYYFVRDKLGILWRRWLTNRFLGRYFKDRAYYELTSNHAIDNPDQRIADDINSFTQQSLRFLLEVIGAVLQLIAFSGHLVGHLQDDGLVSGGLCADGHGRHLRRPSGSL